MIAKDVWLFLYIHPQPGTGTEQGLYWKLQKNWSIHGGKYIQLGGYLRADESRSAEMIRRAEMKVLTVYFLISEELILLRQSDNEVLKLNHLQ